MLAGGGGGQPGGPKDCMEDVKNWWKNCPYFYKFLFVFTSVSYLSSWFYPIMYFLLAEQPIRTVTKFYFWTCSTSFLVPRDFFNWLIGVYLVYHDGKRIEHRIGTVHYCLEMFFKNTLIQIFYITIAYTLYFLLGSQLIMMPAVGLFPTFMLFLTLRGLADPETERPFLCFPVLVKNKWYPWILYGIFALISMSLVPDVLAGIGVAYLEVYVFKGQILTIKPETLQKIENSCFFSSGKKRDDFILLANAGGDGFEMQVPQAQEQQQQPQQPQFSAFQGRGVSIGQGGGGVPILSQQPPAAVINPSQQQSNQISQSEQELRRQAAAAAEARQQAAEQKQNESQEPDDIDDLPDKNQMPQGYNQVNNQSPKEDLL